MTHRVISPMVIKTQMVFINKELLFYIRLRSLENMCDYQIDDRDNNIPMQYNPNIQHSVFLKDKLFFCI